MHVTITYCVRRNYLPQATSLAAAIQGETGVEPKLIKGDNGVFEVDVDGQRIFSKEKTGRFPEHEEVLGQLRGAG